MSECAKMLRQNATWEAGMPANLYIQAAQEIEQFEAALELVKRENAALREALQNLHDEIVDCDDALGLATGSDAMVAARAALQLHAKDSSC